MVLLSQNQQVRIDFLGYMRYEALAKYIKTFKKNIKDVKYVSAWTNSKILFSFTNFYIFIQKSYSLKNSFSFKNFIFDQ